MIPGLLVALGRTPAPPGDAPAPAENMVFEAMSGSNVLLENGDTRHRRQGAGTNYSHTRITRPVRGRRYLEMRLTMAALRPAEMNIYGGSMTTYPTGSSLGQWWGQPGATFGITGVWAWLLYSHYGDGGPNTIGNSGAYELDGSPVPVPATVRTRIAVDESTRAVWLAPIEQPWYGGGDPAAGTLPSFHMEGSSDIYIGGTVGDNSNYVDIVQPGDQVGPVPAGFTYGL